jgi:hypothetical protein
MNAYQEQQVIKNGRLSALTAEIAQALGAPWKVKPPRAGYDDESYPSRYIVNGEGAELVIRIEEYGAKKGRVNVYGSLNIGRHWQYETVYENGNRVNVPDISVNPERGVEVIAKEIKRRLIPEYLRVLGLAQAQVKKANERTAARQAALRKLHKLAGGHAPDFEREPDKDRLYSTAAGTIVVHYDGSVQFERLDVSQEQAEHIIEYLKKTKKAAE